MATTIEVNYVSDITVVKTFDGEFVGDDNTITINGLNRAEELTASTSVPVTKEVSGELTLSSGTGTIDLTALTGDNGEAVSFSGLKVQIAKFKNKSTNANSITIAKGASNGHTGFGANFSLTLPPAGEVTIWLDEASADVGGSDKTIDVSGTGAQVLQYQLVAG